MVSWISFAWQIEIVAVAILIYALIVFLRAIIKLDKDFRIALMLVLGSVVINMAMGIMMGVFIDSGSDKQLVGLWIVRPIVVLIVAILVMLGARKFFKAVVKK